VKPWPKPPAKVKGPRRPIARGKPPKRKKKRVGVPKYLNPLWLALRLARLILDGYRCQWQFPGCTGEATEVDHLEYNKGRGVKSLLVDITLLRSTCHHCHAVRHPWLDKGFGLGSRERNAKREADGE
jgi:hypothetical protein